jgi:hypothetical protein
MNEDRLKDRYDRLQGHEPKESDPDEAYDRLKQEELDDEVMRRDTDAMLLRLCYPDEF